MTGVTGTIYVLANGDEGIGFYKLKNDDSKLAVGKAYLEINKTNNARKFIGLFDDVTGISTAINDDVQPSANDAVYDLCGRKVSTYNSQLNTSNSQLPKGIYIVNGRKTVVK